MHIVFYTSDLAHLHSLSTVASVLLLVGAGYGLLRLAFDAIGVFFRLPAFGGRMKAELRGNLPK